MSNYAVHKITSLEAPSLQPYRTLRRPKEHLAQGLFVAEGEKVVRRFLLSDWAIVSLLLTQEWFDRIIPLTNEARLQDIDVFVGEKSLLETIVGFPLHQGIMGVGRVPRERGLSDMVAGLPSPHFLVALDGLVSAENVGTIARNCAGLGADGLIVDRITASPYLRRAVRNSMGAIFNLPCTHVENLAKALSGLRRQYATRIIIADAHTTTTLDGRNFSGNICIVLGNEDEGTSQAVESLADMRVKIPMHKGTDSLNVASASAILLYEAERYRR